MSSPPPPQDVVGRVRAFGSLVRFSHTVFALPFAGAALVLASGVPHVALGPARLAAILVAMVTARTAAMAFNRWIDRDIDAANPRTATREIPAGVVTPGAALGLTVASALGFIAAAAALGRTPLVLSPVVLAVVLGYSLTKRFTWGAHLVLGVALALAPGGAWIAMGAEPSLGIVALMIAVATWVGGFDVLYSLQDEAFDRSRGLHSIPARFGTLGAVAISAALHVVTVAALVGTGVTLGRGGPFYVGVALIVALLVYEHAIVGKGDLARIDKAFFDVNGWVSCAFFVAVAVDAWRLGR